MPKQDPKQTEPRGTSHSRISKEWNDYLLARSAAFLAYTQQKGRPMTYGAITKEKK